MEKLTGNDFIRDVMYNDDGTKACAYGWYQLIFNKNGELDGDSPLHKIFRDTFRQIAVEMNFEPRHYMAPVPTYVADERNSLDDIAVCFNKTVDIMELDP